MSFLSENPKIDNHGEFSDFLRLVISSMAV